MLGILVSISFTFKRRSVSQFVFNISAFSLKLQTTNATPIDGGLTDHTLV